MTPYDCAVPFTLSNIKEDLQDIGPRFDGAPDLEFRAATKALELEKSAQNGPITVLDVVAARNPDEHDRLVEQWATSVSGTPGNPTTPPSGAGSTEAAGRRVREA